VVSAAIGAPGDGVLTNTPVYGPFLTAPVNQGRVLQSAPLACSASGQELYYTLDMAATAAAVQPNTRLFCSATRTTRLAAPTPAPNCRRSPICAPATIW
jgi:bifunctional pyridoxal-dependent enzyme with beta-cystathionase and maltose regulon repressor activities